MNHLCKGGRCHLMQGKVVPVLGHGWRSLPLSEWTVNAVYTRFWSRGRQVEPPCRLQLGSLLGGYLSVVKRYVAASSWVLLQVLLVSSSVVSAWPLVSRAGHDGVLGCPVYWSTDHILRRSSCSCGPLHVFFWCQLGWTLCCIPNRNRSVRKLHGSFDSW